MVGVSGSLTAVRRGGVGIISLILDILVLGPNVYGFIRCLARVCVRCDRNVPARHAVLRLLDPPCLSFSLPSFLPPFLPSRLRSARRMEPIGVAIQASIVGGSHIVLFGYGE